MFSLGAGMCSRGLFSEVVEVHPILSYIGLVDGKVAWELLHYTPVGSATYDDLEDLSEKRKIYIQGPKKTILQD